MTIAELQTLSDWSASSIRTLGLLRDRAKDATERERLDDGIRKWTHRKTLVDGMMDDVFIALEPVEETPVVVVTEEVTE